MTHPVNPDILSSKPYALTSSLPDNITDADLANLARMRCCPPDEDEPARPELCCSENQLTKLDLSNVPNLGTETNAGLVYVPTYVSTVSTAIVAQKPTPLQSVLCLPSKLFNFIREKTLNFVQFADGIPALGLWLLLYKSTIAHDALTKGWYFSQPFFIGEWFNLPKFYDTVLKAEMFVLASAFSIQVVGFMS